MKLEELFDAALARRAPLLKAADLEAIRLVNGVGDRLRGIHVDRFGPLVLAHTDEAAAFGPVLRRLLEQCGPSAIFRKLLRRNVRTRRAEELEAELLYSDGTAATTGELLVRERELRFLVRARDGYSPGLFLDQRENRKRVGDVVRARLARNGAAGCAVLNTFAYTCSFSVAAAKAGARTTSVDLSARYLDWGRQNFAANQLDPAAHEFARGDVLVYLEIAAKKGRKFDLIVLDPPTFSTSKQRGVFQVERHYPRLFELAARVAAPAASLLCSHNQRTFTRAALATKLRDGARNAGRKITKLTPFTPPPDFPGPDADNPAARGFWVELDA